MSNESRGLLEHLGAFLGLLTRLSNVLGTAIESRTAQFIAIERLEVRRCVSGAVRGAGCVAGA